VVYWNTGQIGGKTGGKEGLKMQLAPNFEKIGGVRYEAVGHKHQEGKAD
jgi:hypothetical protein